MSPAIILERLEKSGGTLEKMLDTVLIDAFAVMVDKVEDHEEKKRCGAHKEAFSQKRIAGYVSVWEWFAAHVCIQYSL